MSDNRKPWRTYEEVAQHLLNEFAAHFGLGRVEGKQVVSGQSGADLEIEAKGVAVNGEAFVMVECAAVQRPSLPKEVWVIWHIVSSILAHRVASWLPRWIYRAAPRGLRVIPMSSMSSLTPTAPRRNTCFTS